MVLRAARGDAPARSGDRAVSSPRGATASRVAAAAFLVLYAALLFARLGHYALWDDEANTGLIAQGVWRTGDTTAVVGHNVVAYRNGYELEGLKNRTIPPLQYYVCAPFVGLLGPTAFAARLPFALFSLGTALLVVHWLMRRAVPLATAGLVYLGLLGNVSLFLYGRQARYYALAVFFSLLVTYLHVERDGSRRRLVGLCAAGSALLLANYLAYAALAAALAFDHLVLARGERRYRPRELVAIAASQAVTAAAALAVWNPIGKSPFRSEQGWLVQKATLLAWNLRDLNAAELASMGLVALAVPLWALRRPRDPVLLRVPVGILVYAAVVALFSPQPVGLFSPVADVRYLVPLIPAGVWVAVRVIEALPRVPAAARAALAAVVFFTTAANVAVAAPFPGWKPELGSTLWAWLGELRTPQQSPYGVAAAWIREHVRPGESVLVTPSYAAYPLMFHAPDAVYAWQFLPARRGEFPGLADVHFAGRGTLDYVVAFADDIREARALVDRAARAGVRFEPAATLDVYGVDMTRPELFWRSFTPIAARNPAEDGVVVFRRVPGGPAR